MVNRIHKTDVNLLGIEVQFLYNGSVWTILRTPRLYL